MTRTLSSLALLLAIALGITPSPPGMAQDGRNAAVTDDVAAAPRGVPEVLSLPALLGAPPSFPGSDPAGHRGDGGSIPQAVRGGVPQSATAAPRGAPEGSPATLSGLSAEFPVPPSVLPALLGASRGESRGAAGSQPGVNVTTRGVPPSMPVVASVTLASRPVGAEGPSVGSNPTTGNGGQSEPAPTGSVGSALIGGWATFYDDPSQRIDHYAAAGPLLRDALGHWRGKVIRVTSGNRSTIVELVDFCACGERHGLPTLLDLSPEAFRDLASLSVGIVRVEIELVELPATDALPRNASDLRMQREALDDGAYR